jgi:hypothetical protein
VLSDVELLIPELGRGVVELDLLESEEVSTLPAASSVSNASAAKLSKLRLIRSDIVGKAARHG